VLTLPIAERQPWLALFAFIGRAFGRDRHGDRRNHRALHHGVQRLVRPVLLRLKALRLTDAA